MKYVFFGSPRFARLVLEALPAGLLPAAVVTNPDRPAGRKQVITPPPVKEMLLEKSLPVELLQPERPLEIADHLRSLDADVFVVAAYGMIIPQAILDIPRHGTIGVHPSLLPKYRGASPIQSAILGGDEMTGVTLYLMDKEVDHGPVLAAADVLIDEKDYLELEAALAAAGGQLLAKTLPAVADGSIALQPQDHSAATFTKKFETADAFVPWERLERAVRGADPAAGLEIWRMVRALNPEPGTWTLKGDLRIKLLKTSLDGSRLALTQVQRAGRTPEAIAAGSLP